MNASPPPGGQPGEGRPPEHGERRRRRSRGSHGSRERRRREKRRRRGANLAGLTGLVIGTVVGLPLGLLAYLVLRETVLPYALWPSETAMWAIIFGVTVPAGLLGLVQGAAPSRLGHALLVGLVAFLLGGLGFGTLGAVASLWFGDLGVAAEALEETEDLATIAKGLAYGLMPLIAAMGGVAVAAFWGFRAWRSWGAWTSDRGR
jgi:hypothetical protein